MKHLQTIGAFLAICSLVAWQFEPVNGDAELIGDMEETTWSIGTKEKSTGASIESMLRSEGPTIVLVTALRGAKAKTATVALSGHQQGSVSSKSSEPSRKAGSSRWTRTVSVYSDYYNGRKMANGKPYSPSKLTVASNDWKLGTKLKLSANGKSVVVTVTDRMARKFSGIRIDASMAVWKALGGGKPSLIRNTVVTEVK